MQALENTLLINIPDNIQATTQRRSTTDTNETDFMIQDGEIKIGYDLFQQIYDEHLGISERSLKLMTLLGQIVKELHITKDINTILAGKYIIKIPYKDRQGYFLSDLVHVALLTIFSDLFMNSGTLYEEIYPYILKQIQYHFATTVGECVWSEELYKKKTGLE